MLSKSITIYRQSGLSLIELVIAVGISSLLMLGLTTTFKSSSDTHRELEKSGALIENGRYAIGLLADDIKHAGFYGFFYDISATPTALPDPCVVGNATTISNNMTTPIQGFAAASLITFPNPAAIAASTTCDDKGLFTNANLTLGSDVLVIRRASTTVLTGTPVTNEVYLQANGSQRTILFGNSSANVPTTAADNSAQTMRKYPFSTTNTTWADTWKYNTHVYFVAPCSFGTGANDVCQAGDDSIPTLKRLELTSNGTNNIMKIEPLAEGIQYMKVRYGIDNSPAAINPTTGFAGDGIPDTYVPAVTAAQWPLVVSVRVYLLVRSPDDTTAYTDTKTYNFSNTTITLGPFNDAFKRHVYSTEVVPTNLSGRREIPE